MNFSCKILIACTIVFLLLPFLIVFEIREFRKWSADRLRLYLKNQYEYKKLIKLFILITTVYAISMTIKMYFYSHDFLLFTSCVLAMSFAGCLSQFMSIAIRIHSCKKEIYNKEIYNKD